MLKHAYDGYTYMKPVLSISALRKIYAIVGARIANGAPRSARRTETFESGSP